MFRTPIILAMSLLFCTGVQATVFKISTEYPDGNAVLNELRAVGERIEAQTEGRVTFKFYPGGVMGDGTAVQRKIRIGQLHGTFIHSGALAESYKNSQVLNAPLLFRDFDEVDAVRAEFDPILNQGFIDSGWHTYGLIEGGFAYAMTAVPATDIETLKSQKLWLPANDPFSEKIARAFDISPIVLNIGDVLTALQTGAIDAIVTPPVGAITLQWYSRTKYLTDAPFMYTYGVIALAEKAVQRLSEADQEILAAELTASSKTLDTMARSDNLTAFTALESLGINIVQLVPEVRAAFEQEAAQATEKLIESGEIEQALYDRIVVVLDRIRNP
ncbi:MULTISPECIES: TRAP transporter substrate-binding protein DctP [Reinekea]|uniref:TRAP-type C4-dicarboxylate transport system, periplasmic component DctP n=1 Tax=Reinekea forsetii TaxID=1336806 RepID=A0A2K8KQM0_9GAMM|nr:MULTISPECIES: TRAP transporter substrate-binding protein DctP [Reinekea]ATX76151.1 TRAP-type C4-dicarboxylate transport system, periplasmic component DctP [Reinekea forsetii]MDO7640989.1 TRAP transporter substrate-binding protein DctP [Reinekea forsetii]